MGILKLSILDEQNKQYKAKMKISAKDGKSFHVGNCSCPCEFYCKHIYSVLLSIRNKEEKRFYKIMYKNPDKSLLERVMEFDYFLCLGVVEQNLEIINNYCIYDISYDIIINIRSGDNE